MGFVLQVIYMGLLLVGIAVAVWLSIWVLLALLAVGIMAVIWSHLREYLIAKGILNPDKFKPRADGTGETSTQLTIEGDFKRVDAEKQE